MRHATTLALASLVILLSSITDSHATFIQPTSISSNAPNTLNTPGVLINAATGNGGASYVPPGPSSGGGGTSWYTSTAGTITTPVTLSFDFASADIYLDLYLWDYYTHTPPNWTLTLYSGLGGTGTQLLSHNFTIVPGTNSNFSTLHVIDFPNVIGALSGKLDTFMNSTSSGVGLAEIGFTTEVPVPEPSTLALLTLGVIGLGIRSRRRRLAA
jgi:hypothetical protein